MNGQDYYEDLKKKTHDFYRTLKEIPCYKLNNEMIHFTAVGFKHLIQKGRTPRSKRDQIRRFFLLHHVEKILMNRQANIILRKESTAFFWEVNALINKQKVGVIVRQITGERSSGKHFFSIKGYKKYN